MRSEANRLNSFMKSSGRSQFRNTRVFSEGEDDGFENKAEKKRDMLVSNPITSVLRAGKDDGLNTMGLKRVVQKFLRCVRRNS